MITTKMLQNANKFLYLVKSYPEKSIDEVIALFMMSKMDINCAIWVCTELKWLTVVEREEEREIPDRENPKKKVKSMFNVPYGEMTDSPKTWDFGPELTELEDVIAYAFEKLGAEEKDLEENYLSNLLTGYFPHDCLIAVKHLIEDNVLHEYEIEDGESAYIFYTLKKNAGKNWGQKQFKTNPLTGEDQAGQEEKTDTATEK